MPSLLYILHPFFTYPSYFKKLKGSQVGKDPIDEKIAGYIAKCGNSIKRELIIIFYCHYVILTHFKLNVSFGCTVLEAVAKS